MCWSLRACDFTKKRLKHRCFPVNIVKCLRIAFFIEHLRWLLLNCCNSPETWRLTIIFPFKSLIMLLFLSRCIEEVPKALFIKVGFKRLVSQGSLNFKYTVNYLNFCCCLNCKYFEVFCVDCRYCQYFEFL